MSFTRLPRIVLLLGALALPVATTTAQRGQKPGNDAKPAAPAPRPASTPAPRPRPIQPQSAPAPRPAPMPRPTPQSAPRPVSKPTPSAPPRSFPRPTLEPQPKPQPRPQPTPRARDPYRQPGEPAAQPVPRPTPRPTPTTPTPRDTRVRTPGDSSSPAPRPTPTPSSTPRSPGEPRAVGGSVRVVERDPKPAGRDQTPRSKDEPKLRPRDLYDDTLARPKSTYPGTPKATPKPGQGRPTTTSQIADRYKVEPKPRGDAGSGKQIKPTNPGPRQKPRPTGDRPKAGPALVDRYATGRSGRPNLGARPRDTVDDRFGNGKRPTLVPRPPTNTRGVISVPAATPPRLVGRPRTTTSVLSHSGSFRGSCFGPVWDPGWSWSSRWSRHCSPGLTWSLGIGSGSFCWGFSSWLPWHCNRSRFGYSSFDSWWDPWCRPYSSPAWWWPRSYYTPVYLYSDPVYVYAEPAPSTVIVVDGATPAGDEAIVVGSSSSSRELAPAERAQRYLGLGDFYFREGRFREAADTYAKARALAPEDATIHFVLADAVFALGDYHFAAFLIGEGLRLDPELARADTDKRLLYGDPKVFETQIQTLVQYLDEKPYDAMAHLVLGYNLKFSAKPKDAEKAFRRVLEIDPASDAASLLLDALTAPKMPDESADVPKAPTEEPASIKPVR